MGADDAYAALVDKGLTDSGPEGSKTSEAVP